MNVIYFIELFDFLFRKKERGPVNFQAMVPQSVLTQEIAMSICREYRITSADIFCRCDATIDQLIDVIEGNRRYIPCIYVLNKIDQLTIEELDIIDQMPHHVPISAHHGWNFDELLETIWDYCKMIRIYTKPKGQIPDYNAPVVLHDQSPTIEDFCNKLHKQMIMQFKYAWVWGSSVRHQPQKCGKEHVLADEDVVQIVKKI